MNAEAMEGESYRGRGYIEMEFSVWLGFNLGCWLLRSRLVVAVVGQVLKVGNVVV